MVVIDYATKWVEAKAFRTNIVIVTTRFLYEYILTRFGCPLTIVIDQGVHFIDDTLQHLMEQILLKHVSSITYNPQGNGQVESTDKVISRLLTKLVNEKKTNWDEHLSTIFFSYKIAYKVATSYTPYQLVYDLHPLMSIKYVLLVISGDHKDAKSTRVLIARITKLKKLKE